MNYIDFMNFIAFVLCGGVAIYDVYNGKSLFLAGMNASLSIINDTIKEI